MPSGPSGKPVSTGGWLVYNNGNHRAYAAKGNKTTEFYRYNLDMGSWDTRASIPPGIEERVPGDGCKGVADGNRFIYMVKGRRTFGFWQYDIVTDSWTQLEDVPPGPQRKKVVGGAGLAYVQHQDTGYVFLLKGGVGEFCRYNTASGNWTRLPDAPAGANAKYGKGSWLVGGGGRLFLHKAKYHELYSFDIATSTWDTTHHPGMPFVGREGKSRKSKDGGCATREGRCIYAFKGGTGREFWKYSIDRNTWAQLETFPSIGSTNRKRNIKAGASLAAHDDTNSLYEVIFTLVGGKTCELWYYELYYEEGSPGGPAASSVAPYSRPALSLTPDPVSSRLACVRYHLENPGRVTIAVHDAAGRVLLTRATDAMRDGSFCLDLRGLGPGTYLARVVAPGFTSTKKFVIVR